MPSERMRHQLYEDLRGIIRVDSADELMAYLPPVGWADVATKADLGVIRIELDALRAEHRGDMSELRAELRGEMSELRGEMAQLRGDVRGEIAELKSDLQRWMITTMIAMTGLFGAIAFGAAKLGH